MIRGLVGQNHRSPCDKAQGALHPFHDACLSEWNQHSAKCPLCNLDWKAAPTMLRYRLKELSCLKAAELKYLAKFLGIEIQGAVERAFLESTILASQHVHLLSSRCELLSMAVGKLKSVAKAISAQNIAAAVEKSELVQAIMASSRFEEEIENPTAVCTTLAEESSKEAGFRHVARDLETALEA